MRRLIAVALLLALTAVPALAQEGVSDKQLGEQAKSWLLEGQAAEVKADRDRLVLSTDKGNVPLQVSGKSNLRGPDNEKITLKDIKPGDPVVVSFHRAKDKFVVSYLYKPSEVAEGRGGRPVEEGAATIGEKELGPPSPAVWGQVEKIEPDKNRLTVKTDQGKQPLEVTGQSTIHGLDLGETGLGNIAQGDRVLVAFKRTDDKAEVTHLYKLPR
jgi:Cu/Ag efflux protein CusF